LEAQIDITLGHKETLELVDESLRAFAQGQPNSLEFPASRGAAARPVRKKKVTRRAAGRARVRL
jgi:hypothetical protein